MNEVLKKFHPNLDGEIQDILWHGYEHSVAVINGKQEWVNNSQYGITNRTRPKKIQWHTR